MESPIAHHMHSTKGPYLMQNLVSALFRTLVIWHDVVSSKCNASVRFLMINSLRSQEREEQEIHTVVIRRPAMYRIQYCHHTKVLKLIQHAKVLTAE